MKSDGLMGLSPVHPPDVCLFSKKDTDKGKDSIVD